MLKSGATVKIVCTQGIRHISIRLVTQTELRLNDSHAARPPCIVGMHTCAVLAQHDDDLRVCELAGVHIQPVKAASKVMSTLHDVTSQPIIHEFDVRLAVAISPWNSHLKVSSAEDQP